MDLLIIAACLAVLGVATYVSYRVAEPKTGQLYDNLLSSARIRERRHLMRIHDLEADLRDARVALRWQKAANRDTTA